MSINYDEDLQTLLISMMLTDPELYVRSSNILEPMYFNKKLAPVVNFIHQYAEKHNGLPNTDIINASYKTKFEQLDKLNDSHKEWYFETVEDFCKKKAMEHAIIKGSEHLEKGNYGEIDRLIKDATMISLHRDMGTNYFKSPRERLEKLQQMNGTLSTGWSTLDKVVYQIGYGELILFTAISGGGKSVAMQNITLNFALNGLNVIYITLELSEELVAKRIDSMLTGIPNAQIYKNMDDVELKVKMTGKQAGKIFIKYMDPGCTPNDLKAYIREFTIQQGVKPDALVIDYMDLMSPNEKRVDQSNLFVKDKLIAESLRSLGSPKNFNMVVISACQINRCLTLDTKVERNGEFVNIVDLEIGDYISSNDGDVRVNEIYDVEEQDVYRITTKSGKVIECSAKHEFPTGDELKSILSGLKIGDKLYDIKNEDDDIISIEFIGKKKTIDISVSGNRLFYANGILTHNSGYQESIPGMDSMAGGMSKAYTADLGIHINNTQQLRTKGLIEYQLTKTRNSGGVGSIIEMAYDIDTLRINDIIEDQESGETINGETGEIIKKNTQSETSTQLKNLLSKIKK